MTESAAENSLELSRQDVRLHSEVTTTEVVALTAFAVASTVVILPTLTAAEYGSKALYRINSSPLTKRARNFVQAELEGLGSVVDAFKRGGPKIKS